MRKILISLTAFFLIIQISTIAFAYNVPEKVKIGLSFGSSAASVVKLSSKSGLIFGKNTAGGFEEFFDISSSSTVIVRKDSYFIKNGSQFTEVKSSNSSTGEKIGPYHIQIGSDYDSFESVNKKVEEMKNDGIISYPAYNGSWHVWYGMFSDKDSAQQSIDNQLKKNLQETQYSIIEPNSQGIVINSEDNILLVFDGDNSSYLGIRPNGADSPALIKINDKPYRGELEFRRYSTSDMTMINIIGVEEYLYGVVAREIGASSPAEAIKAQAVVARNYSANNIGKNSKWGFDMTNTISDQAYNGYEWERPASNNAVDQTRGKLLVYDGKPASTFYFSTSGGRTEDVKNVWNSNGSYPYLVSVEDKYEPANASKAKWEITLTPEQVKQSLKAIGVDIGDILAVRPTEYAESGRVIKLKITGTKSEKVFERSMCRTALGKDVLSQWYTVSTGGSSAELSAVSGQGDITKVQADGLKVKTASGVSTVNSEIYIKSAEGTQKAASGTVSASGGFKITGRGWGHGVGMSQVGAIGMANAGFDYEQILEWYFKGTTVE
ncbi:MAG: SpoIID/LytB domain-containing protein [Deltaproteobacteria bacterium]